jgi:protein-arginine deiminase
MAQLTRLAAALWLLAASAGCGDKTPAADTLPPDTTVQPDLTPAAAIIDLRADVNRNGVVDLTDPTEDQGEERWDKNGGAIFLANLDDDDASCPAYSTAASDEALAACHDAANETIDGSADLLDLARIKTVPWPGAPDDARGSLKLTLPGAAGGDARTHVRLFINEGGSFKVLASGAQLGAAALRRGVELALEGKDIVRDSGKWDGYLDVTLEVSYSRGGQARSGRDTVRLRVAPLMFSHHLQAVDTVYASKIPVQGSVDFRTDLSQAWSAAGGGGFVEIPVNDQWTQDFFETGWMSMPAAGGGQHVITAYVRSANVYRPKNKEKPLRAAGRVVFQLRGKDRAAIQEYDLTHDSDMDTLNSLGNLETVPPHSNGGAAYSMGRLIMGNDPSFYPSKTFTRMLEGQAVQKPLWLDTSWLLVAHVDETISFVKAATPRGWALVLNDPALARKMLQDASAAGNGKVKMFVGKYWLRGSQPISAETTIDEVLADTEIMAQSARAVVEVGAQLSRLKQETGITDAEIIRVPFLHDRTDGYSTAYQPGTANGMVLADGHYAAPDPHGPVINGVDIFKQQLTQAFARYNIKVHFVEDWDLLHRLLGEVHCGANALRKVPTGARWWEAGR